MDVSKEHEKNWLNWLKRRQKFGATVAAVALFASGCGSVTADNTVAPSPTSVKSGTFPTLPTVGECSPFTIRGQNFIDPIGAAVRAEADANSAKVGSVGGNEVVAVTGWTKSDQAAYPENPAPWDGHVWYEVNNTAGLYKDGGDNVVWVNFAGVRKGYSSYKKDNGERAPAPDKCEIT